ncbi:MAG: TetR/AcrR family transcriptional regulator [Oscillospiraceae bacterium]|nr:TetR/AcrR family transcriptional regulator [Oscillospiraceae bacterium]
MNRSESKYFHTAERMDEALLSLLLEKDFEYITVKDVCTRAGVNRSTFYLHYENTAGLLAETVAMINGRYREKIPDAGLGGAGITALPKRNLFFMTDQWLLPWLDFVKENRHVYKAIHSQADVFGVERTYQVFFQRVFSPILSRYGVVAERHEYIMEFYRCGLVAVMLKWVASDCRESAGEIAEIIKLCVGPAADEKTD